MGRIQKKIYLSIILFSLLLTIMADAFVLMAYRHDLSGNLRSFIQSAISQMSENMERTVLQSEEGIYNKIQQSDLIQNGRLAVSPDTPAENERRLRLLSALLSNTGLKIFDSYLLSEDGTEVFWSRHARNIEDFRESEAGKYLSDNMDALQQNRGTVLWMRFDDDDGRICIVKTVINPNTIRRIGTLCLIVDENFFTQFGENMNAALTILNSSDQVLFQNGGTEDRDGVLLEETSHLYKKGWTLTAAVPNGELFEPLRRLIVFLLLLETAFGMACVYIAKKVSISATVNLRSLAARMKDIREGRQAEPIRATVQDETSELVEAFNDMNSRLKESIARMTDSQIQKEKAEYNALVAQMNPHFIYNSLEAVRAMASLHHEPEIAAAISELSGLMRITLSVKQEKIALGMELSYVTQYLKLQQLITGDQFTWDIDCEDDLKEVLVPKLILQPVIENCFVHGFEKMPEDAMIIIVCYLKENHLVIEVSDNGQGMDEAALRQLLSPDNGTEAEEDGENSRRHIGLLSIRERIRHLYGTDGGMDIRARAEQGTTVQFRFPIRRQKVQDSG